MIIIRRIFLFNIFLFIGFQYPLIAQESGQTLDKIVARIGTSILKASDVESQFYEMKINNPDLPDSAKCSLLESLLLQKLLSQQAQRDSLLVSDEEVEGQLENRVRYFIYQYGSEEQLQRITGKTSSQLKEQFRTQIKEQLEAQKMQQQIISKVKVTPTEVETFFNKIPSDSLPKFGSQVEIAQILLSPQASPEIESYTKQKLEEIRKEIVTDGKSFDILAGIYSEDPGSRNKGGELGFITKDMVVPEFATQAFKLRDGEISPVFRTKFGYHIVQMMGRDGDKAKVRHILKKPNITNNDVQVYVDSALIIKGLIDSGKLTFQQAVGLYSTDDQSKMTGGFKLDESGESLLNMEDLDPSAISIIDTLKVGSISEPHIFTDPNTGDKNVRILYLKTRTLPHQANLTDDYSRIQAQALQQKQFDYLEVWLSRNINNFYFEVEKDYPYCNNIKKIISYIHN